MTNTDLNDGQREELIALYQVTIQDLAFFKSQQWNLTNLSLLALAALAGVSQLPDLQLSSCVKVILCVSAGLIALLNAFLLWQLHCSIEERRSRLKRIYEKFSEEFRTARGNKTNVSTLEIVLPLWVILSISFSLILWIIICA